MSPTRNTVANTKNVGGTIAAALGCWRPNISGPPGYFLIRYPATTNKEAIASAAMVPAVESIPFSQGVLLSRGQHDRPSEPVKGRRARGSQAEGLLAAGGAAADT